MIVIGYQGIGKSTLAKNKDLRVIDLESGNFFDNDGNRPDNWYEFYINIAIHLHEQGYCVFLSSHDVVRYELSKKIASRDTISNDDVKICAPDPKLKEEWVNKLRDRYISTNSNKDYKAYKNAEDRYRRNINELIQDAEKYHWKMVLIPSLKYDLKNLLKL